MTSTLATGIIAGGGSLPPAALEFSEKLDQTLAEARQRDLWSRFGTIGFENYLDALGVSPSALW